MDTLDPLSQVSVDGKRFGAILALSLLKSLEPSQREVVRSFGINTLGELLRWEPVHRSRLIVAAADGRLAHDVSFTAFVQNEFANLAVEELADRDPEVIDGIGNSISTLLRSAFGVTTVRELATWEPYVEAEQLVRHRASEFSEPRSAPDELIPAAIGVTVSTARYSSFVKQREVGRELNLQYTFAQPADEDIEELLENSTNLRVGLGYVVAHRQHWISAGVGLGEPVHSLGLAPGETRKVAIVDWRRRAVENFTERTEVNEYLASVLARRRALDEVTRAVAAEHQFGFSALAAGSSVTAGSLTTALSAVGAVAGAATLGVVGSVAGGATGALTGLAVDLSSLGATAGTGTLGLGLAGSISGGVAGSLAGAVAGSVAGGAAANLIVGAAGALGVLVSDSQGERNIMASLQSRLADSTTQKSSNIRGLWSTIITEDNQTESEKVQTVAITNYNHAHALTIQYYELLQRYLVETTLEGAEPFLAVPYRPFEFDDSAVVERHWDLLRLLLEDKDLVESIDAIVATQRLDEVEEPAAAGDNARLTEVRVQIEHPTDAGEPTVSIINSAGDLTLIESLGRTSDSIFDVPVPFKKSLYNYRAVSLDMDVDDVREVVVRFPADAPHHWNDDDYKVLLSAKVQTTAGAVGLPFRVLGEFTRTRGSIGAGRFPFTFHPADELPTQDVASTEAFRVVEELKRLLIRHRYRFTKLILNATEPAQLSDVFEGMVLADNGAEVPLVALVDTEPIGMTDRYILLPLRRPGTAAIPLPEILSEDLSEIADFWQSLHQEIEKYRFSLRTTAEISLPTSGVFAEAIQGSANSAELIDLRRNIAWHEMPIPMQAPDILAVAMGSRFQQATQPDPNVPDSELEEQQPPSAADPGTSLAGILAAIQNGAIFRDMSNAGTLASTLSSLANVANEAAANSGRLSGEALEATLNSALDLGKRVSEASSSLAGQNLDSLTKLGGTLALPELSSSQTQTPTPKPVPKPVPKPEEDDTAIPPQSTTVQLEVSAFVRAEAWFFPFELDLGTLISPIGNIPAEAMSTLLAFSGDTLPAGAPSARARAALDLQIGEDANGRLTIVSSSLRERFFGRSQLFATHQLNDVADRPSWVEAIDDATPLAEFRHETTDEALSFTAAIENGEVVARFRLDAQFYLPPPTQIPDIEIDALVATFSLRDVVDVFNAVVPNCVADVAVHIFKGNDGVMRFRMEGVHDRFPSFDVQVNGEQADSFDPEAANTTPNALFPGATQRRLPTDARLLPPR